MNIELKPCPFCGGKAELRDSPNSRSEEGMSFYEVRCKNCGVYVRGESFNFWVVKYNRENPQDQLSAVERWNKRAYEEDGRKTGKWIYVHPLQEDDGGAYKCSCCSSGSWCVDPTTWRACPWCMALMETERRQEVEK